MSFDECVEPLRLMFWSEIDAPLSIMDISDSLLLAKQLHLSMCDEALRDTQEYLDAYKFTLHHHFDLDVTGITSNLQLRSIVATIKNIVQMIDQDITIGDTIFDDIIEMIPRMFYDGTESEFHARVRHQIKLRLAGIAPTYNMNKVTSSTGSMSVDAFFSEIVSEVD